MFKTLNSAFPALLLALLAALCTAPQANAQPLPPGSSPTSLTSDKPSN